MAKPYRVKQGETFPQLASRLGLPLPSLLKLNPGVKTLTTGMGINLPQGRAGISPRFNIFDAIMGKSPAPPVSGQTGIYMQEPYRMPGFQGFQQGPYQGNQGNLGNVGGSAGVLPEFNYANLGINPATITQPRQPGNGANALELLGLFPQSTQTATEATKPTSSAQPPGAPFRRAGDGQSVIVTLADGNPAPAVVSRDEMLTASFGSGMDSKTLAQSLGYVLYGGQYVYMSSEVTTPTTQSSGKPARNAKGTLLNKKRQQLNEAEASAQQAPDTGTAQANYSWNL
jgi:hypothetical protein